MKKRIKRKEILRHETKRSAFTRFLIVLGIFLIFLIFMGIKYGFENGLIISLLTWSFFVFCTPLADAGFLFDFPVRLFTGIRMIYSEIGTWIFAALLNIYYFSFNNEIYAKTNLLLVFKLILSNPFPYWSMVLLSALGTFLSVYFGDELMDVVKHRQRKKYKLHKRKYLVILVFFMLIVLMLFLYNLLLKKLGISI